MIHNILLYDGIKFLWKFPFVIYIYIFFKQLAVVYIFFFLILPSQRTARTTINQRCYCCSRWISIRAPGNNNVPFTHMLVRIRLKPVGYTGRLLIIKNDPPCENPPIIMIIILRITFLLAYLNVGIFLFLSRNNT